MGIIDQFTAEGKAEIKITTLMDIMRYAAKALYTTESKQTCHMNT